MLKALVVGNKISGKSAKKLLKKIGYKVIMIEDDKSEKYYRLKDRLFMGLSFVVVSPGVKPDSEIILKAKEYNIRVVGEFELGTNQVFGDMIAITGTNGKTTTTTLIYEIIKSEFKTNSLTKSSG